MYQIFVLILLILLFFVGLYLYARKDTWTNYSYWENSFYNTYNLLKYPSSNGDCPNLLIQNDSKFYLYNKKKPEIKGENPIIFDNLEQYVLHIRKQKMLGINCPVLYVQKTMGAQGNTIYKIRSTPEDPQGGTPPPQTSSSPKNITFPKNAYDQKMYLDNLAQSISNNLSISQANNVDKLELTKNVLLKVPEGCPSNIDDIKPLMINGKTADPMTTNWGGPLFTQQLIDQGHYVGNEIYKSGHSQFQRTNIKSNRLVSNQYNTNTQKI
jgi:hypothetical protein